MTKYFKEGLTNIELNDNNDLVLTLNDQKFYYHAEKIHIIAIGSGIGEISLVTIN